MRRGFMKWREDELSMDELGERVARLRAAMEQHDLDAFLAYTTLVRPAAVHYLTGFTPYWSDGLLLLTREGTPIFVTALSMRVGQWLSSVNPTSQIMHAPSPGRKIGELLAQRQIRRLGALELDMMPGALVEDMKAAADFELIDASDVFASIRAERTVSECRLAGQAETIARRSFAELSPDAATVGEIAGPLERAVRWAGAEECYIATAPDLSREARLARHHGDTPLGDVFAARVSVAHNGVWTRFTRTLKRGAAHADDLSTPVERIAAGLDLSAPAEPQIIAAAVLGGIDVSSWMLEAPFGTRPLKRVAGTGHDGVVAMPYGVLSLTGHDGKAPFLFSTLVLPRRSGAVREAA